MPRSPYVIRKIHGYTYYDEGPASRTPPVVLLHGMLGTLRNWEDTIGALSAHHYRTLAPELPIYDLPFNQSSVRGLVRSLHRFLQAIHPGPIVLVGNSLGGHVALLYALAHPERIASLVLSGSSGIYEVELGTSTMRRKDRSFIRERAALTFFSPEHVTDDLVEAVYDIVNDRARVLRLIRMARSVQAETVTQDLARITSPTLLIWGKDDQITPPEVAHTFLQNLPHAQLYFIDRCGHAPMIEQPALFNERLLAFLADTVGVPRAGTSSLQKTTAL